MSKKAQQYPPENIQRLDKNVCEFRNKIFKEIAKKFKMTENELEEITGEVAEKLSAIMAPEHIGTVYNSMGFQAVDPKHFNSLQYLRIHVFLDMLLPDSVKPMYMHELSLMLLEIKELRAVLQNQFNYDWNEHRKNFPLVAQSVI